MVTDLKLSNIPDNPSIIVGKLLYRHNQPYQIKVHSIEKEIGSPSNSDYLVYYSHQLTGFDDCSRFWFIRMNYKFLDNDWDV